MPSLSRLFPALLRLLPAAFAVALSACATREDKTPATLLPPDLALRAGDIVFRQGESPASRAVAPVASITFDRPHQRQIGPARRSASVMPSPAPSSIAAVSPPSRPPAAAQSSDRTRAPTYTSAIFTPPAVDWFYAPFPDSIVLYSVLSHNL